MAASDKEMEDYARDCVRLAQLAKDSELREQFLQIARDWMATATHVPEYLSRRTRRTRRSKAPIKPERRQGPPCL